ncbi:MBL fold metallo-hydrolase [Chitinophaga polysaccharea]|uniref:MBL fold metallo-hydrolase n=1 Tax=Chitinophaga TaxID=79328 RepID=UPI001455B8BF|nr:MULTISPECIES: MBL fold metallo-hydrolase [Chitinophaga]NLR59528.1 MBL fold metallo-hydrolase [Chitinophaga polysaccharea]NLU96163.1 MBL fold metallo-hydrolase [Chitinophaga sp. Ak27]
MLLLTMNHPAGFTAFRSGKMEIFSVTDGDVIYEDRCFAPGFPRALLGNNLRHFILPHNILVLRFNNRVVMFDAGNGDYTAPEAGLLRYYLHAAGITPESITDIILTHAHPDHINGLVGIGERLMFPDARIHLSQAEYDFWMSDSPDFSKSKNAPAALLQMQQHIKGILALLNSRLQLFNSTDALLEGIQPIAAAGHTPGHTLFAINTGEEQFIHMADTCHEDELLFRHPEWGTIFDIDFEQAARARQATLRELANKGQLVFGYHLPAPGFGKVIQAGDGFVWKPQ